MTKRWNSYGLFAATWLFGASAYPCTTFLAQHEGQLVMGKDYDWTQNAGLVVTNGRGLRKTALTLSTEDAPATWVSKYASLTFNQYGVEFPNGGINEKGLMVEVMWLESSQYPVADSRPVVNELQWIQYALDGFSSIAELVPAAAAIRVARAYAAVHYLACDATAACAAFEYINGNLVVTTAATMTAKTLANDTFANSVAYLAGFTGFGGTAALPASSSSLDRFVRASSLARTTDGTTIPTSAFQILDSVAQSSTQWSIVYAPMQGTVYFRTKTTPKLKSVSLSSYWRDCSAPRKALDIDVDVSGDVTSLFVDYTLDLNRQLVNKSMSAIASHLPTGALELVAAYPSTYQCAASTNGAAGSGGTAVALAAAGGAGTTANSTGGGSTVSNTRPPSATGGTAAITLPDGGVAGNGASAANPSSTANSVGEKDSASGCSCTLVDNWDSADRAWLAALGLLGIRRRRLCNRT